MEAKLAARCAMVCINVRAVPRSKPLNTVAADIHGRMTVQGTNMYLTGMARTSTFPLSL